MANDETFKYDAAREAIETFPDDLSADHWREYLGTLVRAIDTLAHLSSMPEGLIFVKDGHAQFLKVSWIETAAMRKARDVVLYTLEDPRLPNLLAALVQMQPLFDAMRRQVQTNISKGVDPQDNFRALKWLKDLENALGAMRQ